MRVTLRRRTFGELLQQSFSLTAAHFVPLLVIVALVSVPQLVAQLLQPGLDPTAATPTAFGNTGALAGIVAMTLLNAVLWPVAQGAAIFLVSGSFTGRNVALGEALRRGLQKWPSLLAFGLAYGLLAALGALLLFVGTFIVVVVFYVGAPAIVVEDGDWRQGFGRSRELTRGHRWTIFGLVVVLGLLVFWLPGIAVGIGAQVVGGASGTALGLVTWVIGVFASTVWTVAPVVVYFNLRVIKESFDVEQLAALVDVIGERQPAT